MAKNIIPVLPLRDIVVFPNMVAPLFVGREQSVNALNYVMSEDKKIFLLSQINSKVDNPNKDNLYSFGTVAKVIQLLKLPDGTLKVLVEGLHRAKVNKLNFNKEFITASITEINKKTKYSSNIKALKKLIIEQFVEFKKINKKVSMDVINNIRNINDPDKVADIVVSNISISLFQKQEILEILNTEDRLNKIYGYLVSEIDSFQVEKNKRSCQKTNGENSERILLKRTNEGYSKRTG